MNVAIAPGNDVRLLMSCQAKFDDLFREVENARDFIHMEYFNFRNDSINHLLINLLAKKVKEGVEVRVMYDAFGNSSNNQPIKKVQHDSICSLGIHLEKFDPLRFPWVNHIYPRDHRKIVVIDGRVAYTGGMNVADYYINGLEGIGPWRDMHMRIEGPAVNNLHYIFCRMWADETGEILVGSKYFPQHNEQDGQSMLGIIDRQPRETNKSIRQLYCSMLDNARHKVLLINPYFVLVPSVKHALERAIDRGVNVQIMVSAKSDVPLTPDAVFYTVHKLMKRGAHVWLYKPGFHHSKILMVDGTYCTVGSANLDARSMRFDYEDNAVILDPAVTRQLDDMFDRDKLDSFYLTDESWNNFRTSWQKFRGWFGHLLRPFL
jgi:cardiolipin synthase